MNVRQSTARTITVGPILDSTGVAKADEVVASVLISKNGGAYGALDGSATLTHSQTGFYLLALTVNDLDTLGCAEFTLNSGTNSMPIRAINVQSQGAWDKAHATWSATRGFAGTGVPDAAADAAGGLPISDAGGLDMDAMNAAAVLLTAARAGALTDWINGGRLDLLLDAIKAVTDAHTPQTGDSFARLGAPAGASHAADLSAIKSDTGGIANISNNTRVTTTVPAELQVPAAASNSQIIHLLLYDNVGNMEAPDAAPTVALVDNADTDLSARLDSTTMTLVDTGHYKVVYTNTAGDDNEQLLWTFTVVEGGLTRVIMRQMQLVDIVAADFTEADRTKITEIHAKIPSKNYLAGTANADGDVQLDEATGTPADSAGVGTLLTRCAEARLAELDAANLPAAADTAATQSTAAAASAAAPPLAAAVGALPAGAFANQPVTGFKLASDGLDSVATTAPSGVAANFREMIVQLWRRFFKKSTLTATQLKTYADNGTDVLTTQAVSDDSTTQTQGDAS